MITVEQLKKFAPDIALQGPTPYEDLCAALNATMSKHGIDKTARRVRYFMTQCHVESRGFRKWDEDLYYKTADRLVVVFAPRVSMTPGPGYAPDYLRNAEKLGNFVYAKRFGNGDVASGDGFRFRGRGVIGLTFRDNYAAFSKATYGDDRAVKDPDMVSKYVEGVESAGWFWSSRALNSFSDTDSFTAQTKVINGSDRSVPERLPILKVANSIF